MIILLVRAATLEGTIQVLDLTKDFILYTTVTTGYRVLHLPGLVQAGHPQDLEFAAGQILSSLRAGNATMPTLEQGPQGQFQIILGFFLVITLECVICVCNILTFNREKTVWVS